MKRRKVLITGAASGIGRASAIRFAEEGCDICLNDVQPDKLRTVAKDLFPGNHLILEGSYADEQTILAGEQMIKDNWGSIDVLVNCAGIFRKTNPLEMTIHQWREVFDSMVNGCFLQTQLATKYMEAGGRIIHITSIH